MDQISISTSLTRPTTVAWTMPASPGTAAGASTTGLDGDPAAGASANVILDTVTFPCTWSTYETTDTALIASDMLRR
jgi:hypothetical protein